MRIRSHFVHATLSIVVAALAAACSGGGDGGDPLFTAYSTKKAVAASTLTRVQGKWLVFQADEQTSGSTAGGGTNMNALNGDVDAIDQIAVVVDMASKGETALNVACYDIAIIGNHVYLAVDESDVNAGGDSFDWSNDGDKNDLVLVHYPKTGTGNSSPAAPKVEFVCTLDSGDVPMVVAGGRLYVARDDSTGGLVNGDTTLAYITTAQPTVLNTVLAIDNTFIHHPSILGVDEDLVFLYEDENVELQLLNGDADQTDGFVLALLDGTDPAALVRSVELGLEGDSEPFRAKKTGTGDWLVAFLVDEASEGQHPAGLNNPADGTLGLGANWKPSNCPTYADTDITDNVLHFLNFKNWDANPVANPPENTGIPGKDRVICVTGAVATIVLETDESSTSVPAGCDLNDNGETDDEIVRWVKTATPQLPYTAANRLVAVADVPGGTHGVTDLDGKLLVVVNESDDFNHDGNPADNNLLAWRSPTDYSNADWTYDHSTSQTLFFGTTWLAESPKRDFVRLAFEERVFAQNVGSTAADLNVDGDATDSIPALADFGGPSDLDFVWPRNATLAGNAGVVIFNNVVFFRISEAADKVNYNGDGDTSDFVLARTATNFSNRLILGTLNDIPDRNAVEGGGTIGVAWIADEALDGRDYDKDGDTNEKVVRWCRIGS